MLPPGGDILATQKPPKVLAPSQEEKLLAFLQQQNFRDYFLVKLCLSTGLRTSEVLGLNVGDVYAFGAIHTMLEIRPAIAHQGNARSLPLVEEMQSTLEDFISWKKAQGESLNFHSPLFVTKRNHKRLAPRDFQRLMKKGTKQALSESFSPHSLRHTLAMKLSKKANLKVVQQVLGHGHPRSTSIYEKTDHDKLKEAFEAALER